MRPCFRWSALAVLVVGSCTGPCGPEADPPPPPPPPALSGEGTITVDGAERAYIVDPSSHMVVLVTRGASAACRLFHSHAVASKVASFAFDLDKQQPTTSTFSSTVVALGLDPDAPESRALFAETRDQAVSDSDRSDIRVSTLAHLDADQFPTLNFAARELTTLDGAGTATLDITIKGATSTVTAPATATWDGERLSLAGQARFDGTPHRIPDPGEVAADCVERELVLDFLLVLVPGSKPDGGLPDAGAPYTPTFFPDDGGCGDPGFDQARHVLVKRCAGCHSDTAPYALLQGLASWEDFRRDGPRAPGVPLYQVSLDRMQAPTSPDAGVVNGYSYLKHMPPIHDGDEVPPDEVALVQAWVNAGARRTSCTPFDGGMAPDASIPQQSSMCGTYGFTAPAGGDPFRHVYQVVLNRYGCVDCHTSGAAGGTDAGLPWPPLDSLAAGRAPVNHPYYEGMTLWRASLARMQDLTMPPTPEYYPDGVAPQDLAMFATWLDEGTPADACPTLGPVPVIESILPGSALPGQTVSIIGTNLGLTPTVVFTNNQAATVDMALSSETQLVVQVPANAITGPVRVTTDTGTAISPSDFVVQSALVPPRVLSVVPATTLVGSTPQVELVLDATGPAQSGAVVQWDGTDIVTTRVDSTHVRINLTTAMTASAGYHALVVRNPDGGVSNAMQLIVENPLPGLATSNPASITLPRASSLDLALSGTGFVNGVTNAVVNGLGVMLQATSATAGTVTVPATLMLNPGTLTVTVSNPSPGGGTSNALAIPMQNPPPTLSSISPTTTPAATGNPLVLTVTGAGFSSSARVTVDGAPVPTVVNSATQLTATLDPALTAVGGTASINVTMTGAASPTNPQTLTMQNPTPGGITVQPSSFPQNEAITLVVSGTGFIVPAGTRPGTGASLSGGATGVTGVRVLSNTRMEVDIAAQSPSGSRTLTITNPAPVTGGGSATSTLTVTASPTGPYIVSLDPNPLGTTPAAALTIRGGNFKCSPQPPSTVTVGGTSVSVSTCSASQLVTTTFTRAAGNHDVVVHNGATTSSPAVLVVAAPTGTPIVQAITPTSVPAGSGSFTLTVTGSNFAPGAAVQFQVGGSPEPPVAANVSSSTSLAVAVPSTLLATEASVVVRVVNPAPGGATSTSSATLTVTTATQAPQITALSPSTVTVGSTPTIRVLGSGFTSGSRVFVDDEASARTTALVGNDLEFDLLAGDTAAAGTALKVVVDNAGLVSNAYYLPVIDAVPSPVLTTLSPTQLTAGTAATLTLTGTGFGTYSEIHALQGTTDRILGATFNSGTGALAVALTSSDTAVPGTWQVFVRNPSPAGDSAQLPFAVTNPLPHLTSAAATATLNSTAPVVLVGTGFVPGVTRVLLDGAERTTSVLSTTQLGFTPQAADVDTNGETHALVARNPAPGGGDSPETVTLTVSGASNPVPQPTTMSPCGTTAGAAGFELVISGTRFATGATVRFNGAILTPSLVSSSEIRVNIPGSAIATAPADRRIPVVVTNPGPGGGDSTAIYFGLASRAATLAEIQTQVFAITQNGCLDCHSGAKAPNLSPSTAYSQLVGVASSGCLGKLRVKACAPTQAESVLLDKVATDGSPICGGTSMPGGRYPSLTDARQQLIMDWIARGAPAN